VPCSASRVVPGAHRVVGPGTHRGSGPREVHTTVIQMIPGAPHQEGTQRETPNRLEASLKSKKHESMLRDASKLQPTNRLEMLQSFNQPSRGNSKGLSKLLYLTLEITPPRLQPTPRSKESNLVSRREGRSGVNAHVFLSRGWSAMSEGEERGYKYLTLKTSRYCAKLGTLGTSDPGSVLPRGAEKLNSGALSVLPTQGRYYRGSG
jgi:hypothetical protein